MRLIPFIHANLDAPPGRNIFPAKLEIVFPLLFPLHQLVGMNHNALPDCLQTRLLADTTADARHRGVAQTVRGAGGLEARGSGQIKSAGSAQFHGHKTVALSDRNFVNLA